MQMGEVLRYGLKEDAKAILKSGRSLPASLDGLNNFFAETLTYSGAEPVLAILESGINRIGRSSSGPAGRVPAILIRSSPHKAGSASVPWQDHFSPDTGHIRYFGDAKPSQKKDPEGVPGNKAVLEQFQLHHSPSRTDRLRAAPLVFFRGIPHSGRQKGHIRFQGVGLVSRAERVVQWQKGSYFVNYVYDTLVIDLAEEGDGFDWSWIRDRRNPNLSDVEALRGAPASWKTWVKDGPQAWGRIRRRVVAHRTQPTSEQTPAPGSKLEAILGGIYAFYSARPRKKQQFEALAELVTERVILDSGAAYRRGWITPEGNDHGVDFVGRIDLGVGFASTPLIVLGQAKCEQLRKTTNGMHIARVAARLRRGYIGAYVTTSTFSDQAQREVMGDRYPMLLIHGLQLAQIVNEMMADEGLTKPSELTRWLQGIDAGYRDRIRLRDPEEILLD